jgi:glutaredoxin
MYKRLLLCTSLCNGLLTHGFVPSSNKATTTTRLYESNFVENIQQDLLTRWRIFQESRRESYDFKQTMANVIAGDYDVEAVRTRIQQDINAAPLVLFTWELSPPCQKAIKALDLTGADYKVVRLDKPWNEGNPIRAELGKRVGRSSVPMVFLKGEYVGGYDGGVDDNAPGLVAMAFQGTLLPRLVQTGALKK